MDIKNVDKIELEKMIKILANSKEFKYNFEKDNKYWKGEIAIYDNTEMYQYKLTKAKWEASIAKFKPINIYTLIIKDYVKNKVKRLYIYKNMEEAEEGLSEIANHFEKNKFNIENFG